MAGDMPMVRPPCRRAARETISGNPVVAPVTSEQPCEAMATPSRSAVSCNRCQSPSFKTSLEEPITPIWQFAALSCIAFLPLAQTIAKHRCFDGVCRSILNVELNRYAGKNFLRHTGMEL